MKKTSIILSTYNEADCIENTINLLRKNIPNLELVIVDDNSSDGTFEIIKKFEDISTKIIQRERSKGLASAFLCGLINTSGDVVGWIDSNMGDLSIKFPEMISELDVNDIIVLSRYIKGGGDERNKIRIIASKSINLLCNVFLTSKIKDFTSSIFVMNRNVLNEVVPVCYGHGEFFIEFLYKCYEKKFKIKELPYIQPNDITGNSKTAPNLIKFFYVGFFYLLRVFNSRFRRD